MTWEYQPAPDLGQSPIERLRAFPRQPDLTVYLLRSTAAVVMRAWLKVYHRFEIRGRENLPADRSFILVSNHSSHLDTLALLATLPLRRLHQAFPAAAEDYFFVSMPRMALSTIFINAIPFARHGKSRGTLEMCRALLHNRGNVLILYPEGTRTTTGRMGPFRPGIGALLAGTGTPVIPCGLRGAFAAWPKGKCIPRPRKLTLTIGTPRTYASTTPDKHGYEFVATDLHKAVEELL